MGGTAKSISPVVHIRRSSAALIEQIEKGNPEKRRKGIEQLANILIESPDRVTPEALQTLVCAMRDPVKSVAIMADSAVFLLGTDHQETVFPILLKEEKYAEGEAKDLIGIVIDDVYRSVSGFRKETLKMAAEKQGRSMRDKPERPSLKEIVSKAGKNAKAPARPRRATQRKRVV